MRIFYYNLVHFIIYTVIAMIACSITLLLLHPNALLGYFGLGFAAFVLLFLAYYEGKLGFQFRDQDYK